MKEPKVNYNRPMIFVSTYNYQVSIFRVTEVIRLILPDGTSYFEYSKYGDTTLKMNPCWNIKYIIKNNLTISAGRKARSSKQAVKLMREFDLERKAETYLLAVL